MSEDKAGHELTCEDLLIPRGDHSWQQFVRLEPLAQALTDAESGISYTVSYGDHHNYIVGPEDFRLLVFAYQATWGSLAPFDRVKVTLEVPRMLDADTVGYATLSSQLSSREKPKDSIDSITFTVQKTVKQDADEILRCLIHPNLELVREVVKRVRKLQNDLRHRKLAFDRLIAQHAPGSIPDNEKRLIARYEFPNPYGQHAKTCCEIVQCENEFPPVSNFSGEISYDFTMQWVTPELATRVLDTVVGYRREIARREEEEAVEE